MELHRQSAVCASCHAQIDPPGFALENYDIIGGWREFYRSKQPPPGSKYVDVPNYPGKKMWQTRPVEAGGETADGQKLSSLEDYKRILLRDPDQHTRNLAQKLLVYGTGAALQFADRAAVEEIVAAVRARNHGFRALIHEVVQSRVFQSK